VDYPSFDDTRTSGRIEVDLENSGDGGNEEESTDFALFDILSTFST